MYSEMCSETITEPGWNWKGFMEKPVFPVVKIQSQKLEFLANDTNFGLRKY